MERRQTPTLTELAETITQLSKKVTDYLAAENLPQPSFAADGPSPDYLGQRGEEISQIRLELAGAAKLMHDLSLGAKGHFLLNTLVSHHECHVYRTIYEFDIARHVPQTGSISYADLSKAINLQEDKVRRILAFAFTMQLFQEPKPDEVGHTASSLILVTDPVGRDWLGHMFDDVMPSSVCQTEALKTYFRLDSKPDDDIALAARSGAGIAFKTKKDIFSQWAEAEPHRIGRFINAMEFIKENPLGPGREIEDAFDWNSLKSGKILDVGGSGGHKAIIMATTAKELHTIVQDRPEVVAEAKKNATDNPVAKKLLEEGRLDFEAYDFFEPQPITDADAYFLGRILHDWDDADSQKIIANQVASMKPGSYLIINDFVLPRPGTASWMDERILRAADMNMMVGINSRERSLDQWMRLMEQGSGGKLKYAYHKSSIIVFVRKD